MRLLVRLMALLLFAFGTWASRADDCTKPKSMEDIKALVNGLGYDIIPEDDVFRIMIDSNGVKYPVYFSITKDQANLIVFTNLGTIPQDKLEKIPTIAILLFNDAHFNYLALSKHEGHLRFALENTMPPGAATPQLLRSIVSHLIDDANASQALWDPEKWN